LHELVLLKAISKALKYILNIRGIYEAAGP